MNKLSLCEIIFSLLDICISELGQNRFIQWLITLAASGQLLTHWGWDKMDNISQMTFSTIFLSTKKVWVLIKLSLKFVSKGPINNIPTLVQIMLGTVQVTSHKLVQWWLVYRLVCITRPQWVKLPSATWPFSVDINMLQTCCNEWLIKISAGFLKITDAIINNFQLAPQLYDLLKWLIDKKISRFHKNYWCTQPFVTSIPAIQ